MAPITCLIFLSALSGGDSAPQKGAAWAAELQAFFADVDANYPFFDLKGIRKTWTETERALLAKAKTVKTEAEFVALVGDAISALRDAHAKFTFVRPKMPDPEPEYWPGVVLLPATEGRVVVAASARKLSSRLPPGTVVTKIDGKDARRAIEQRGRDAWEAGGSFSSPQRALFFEYRLPLRGKQGTRTVLSVLDGKAERKIEVVADEKVSGWIHTYNEPADLSQAGQSLSHGVVGKGFGYLYVRRIDEGLSASLSEAIAQHPKVDGWIVDLRGNAGGGYDDALLDATKKLKPPVVAILDAGCISAGETYARDLKRLCSATLIGAVTAGSSSQKREHKFASGVATVQYSIKSRFGPDGQPIEWHGIKPDRELEARPEDLATGKNTEIEEALRLLQGAAGK